jgi:hypothetical protein
MSHGNQRTKHVDILEKFRSELEVNNEVGTVYVPTQHNPADILTKIQTTEAFLRSNLQYPVEAAPQFLIYTSDTLGALTPVQHSTRVYRILIQGSLWLESHGHSTRYYESYKTTSPAPVRHRE